MNAIILAAGIGSRIGTMGESTPKCLLSVAGEPLLVHQVRKLRSSGIENITAVVGGQGVQSMERFGELDKRSSFDS